MTVTVITEGVSPSVEDVGYDALPLGVVKQFAHDGDVEAQAWLKHKRDGSPLRVELRAKRTAYRRAPFWSLLSGVQKPTIAKRGDSEGHDFHGNQWTGGHGGGGDAKPHDGHVAVGLIIPASGDTQTAAHEWGGYRENVESRYAAECMLGGDHPTSPATNEELGARPEVMNALAEGHLTGADWIQNETQDAVDRAYTLLQGVRDAEPAELSLFRGVSVNHDDPGAEALMHLKTLDTFDLGLASFSNSMSTAESFSKSSDAADRVMIQVAPGARGVASDGTETQVFTGHAWHDGHDDVITSGRFEVTSTSIDRDGVRDINVKQIGVFDPDHGGSFIQTDPNAGDNRSLQVVLRGDSEGHDFHGNQWTGGHGGGDKETPFDKSTGQTGTQRLLESMNEKTFSREDMFREGERLHGLEGAPRGEPTEKMASDLKAGVAHDLAARMSSSTEDMVKATLGSEQASHLGDPNYTYVQAWPTMGTFVPVGHEQDELKHTDRPGQALSINAADPRAEAAIRDDVAGRLVSQWAGSSNDLSIASIAIQDAAQREFGLTGTASWKTDEETQHFVDLKTESAGAVYQDFLRAQYDSTQGYLKGEGVKELTVARGWSWEHPEDVPAWAAGSGNVSIPLLMPNPEASSRTLETIETRPLSSWSTRTINAMSFAGTSPYGAVTFQSVPADRILSIPLTGNGALNEREVVVLGGQTEVVVTKHSL